MSYAFAVIFPALMTVAPAAFLALWCAWTGLRGMRRTLLATLACLVAYGAYAAAMPAGTVASSALSMMLWGLVPCFGLCWGFVVPTIRAAVAALPPVPRGARLATRRIELPRAAFVVPLAAWAALAAATALRGDGWLAWVGPAAGLLGLAALPIALRFAVLEPEPLGGPDPTALAREYDAFRRRRVLGMYALFVVLNLSVSAATFLPKGTSGGVAGAAAGSILGLSGALFGTWADAQRYLLRRQLSGARPPGRRGVQSAA